MPPVLFFFLKFALAIQGLLWFHKNFRIVCSIYLFIYLFIYLAALGLCCCLRAFSSCSEWGLLFAVVCGPLIVVVSPAAEHEL